MRIFGWPATFLLAMGTLIAIAGCKPNEAIKRGAVIGKGTKPNETGAPKSAAIDESTTGTIRGTVNFAGKAPERLKIDMSQDPVCSITGGENLTEQYVVHGGKLANVYLYIKDGPGAAMNAAPQSTAPVVMDQMGCKYTPHVIAVMRGGTVEFRNSDGTMHNIHTMPTGNPVVDVSQGAKGAPEKKQFDTPEMMMPVRCNNHPWMNAFINVSATPFFAVSDADGKFEIKGLPAGTYTLAAAHEKMGEQTMKVTVSPKESTKTEFTYSMK
ncbi:carboxypeptidase regulatory-like domain-containing protein [Edaphobacter aggregans]|uniref:carboxypeptidase regulatory-like domain-containing protein n=1 Tax=Edaphobacter aggregans TaxID=570835 RepID=UPI00068F132F|nr:carboxypeptidase regulatory-like domain-containing protein [Edaphobacter aggregans]